VAVDVAVEAFPLASVALSFDLAVGGAVGPSLVAGQHAVLPPKALTEALLESSVEVLTRLNISFHAPPFANPRRLAGSAPTKAAKTRSNRREKRKPSRKHRDRSDRWEKGSRLARGHTAAPARPAATGPARPAATARHRDARRVDSDRPASAERLHGRWPTISRRPRPPCPHGDCGPHATVAGSAAPDRVPPCGAAPPSG
jgi:hypothetical protein